MPLVASSPLGLLSDLQGEEECRMTERASVTVETWPSESFESTWCDSEARFFGLCF